MCDAAAPQDAADVIMLPTTDEQGGVFSRAADRLLLGSHDFASLSGFLVPAVESGLRVTSRSVVVLLEGLEKTPSMTGLLGDLCHNLENRGSTSPLVLSSGTKHLPHIQV